MAGTRRVIAFDRVQSVLDANTAATNAANTAVANLQTGILNPTVVPSVSSIAALKGIDTTGLTFGTRVDTLGYYANGDGGGNLFYWDNASTATDNGGTVIIPTAGGTGRWIATQRDVINVKQFGARGNGSTDDSAAIQTAFNAAQDIRISNDGISADSGSAGYTGIGYSTLIQFPRSTYALGGTVTCNPPYIDIDLGGSLFVPSAGFDQTTFVMRFPDLQIANVKGGRFIKFKKVMEIKNANGDIGQLNFSNFQFNGADLVLEIRARSTRTTFSNIRFDNCKKACIVATTNNPPTNNNGGADKLVFEKVFMNPGRLDNDYDGIFEIQTGTNSPGLELIDFFFTPRTQTASNCSIVKIGATARVTVDRAIFGGEPGMMPIVSNFVKGELATGASETRGTHITILNSMIFPSSSLQNRAAVELYDLPNSIVFSNVHGYIEETNTDSLISFKGGIGAPFLHANFAAAEAALVGTFDIHIEGRQAYNWRGLPDAQDDKLMKYINTRPRTFYGSVSGVTNTVGQTIVTTPANTFFGKGNCINVKIIPSEDAFGAGRYSEYVVMGDLAGNIAEIVPIYEGPSSLATRLVLNGSNLQIRSNTDASPRKYNFQIEKIGTYSSGI